MKLLKTFWIYEIFCLKSKKYVFKCGGNSKNKLKGVSKSQPKHFAFEKF